MHARKSIFHTDFGAEEEHQNKRTAYPILCDKMGRMEARTQPVAHTKTKAQPPDRCCETGRRWCLPIGFTLRPKGRTDHQPAASASLHKSSFACVALWQQVEMEILACANAATVIAALHTQEPPSHLVHRAHQ